MEITVAGAGAGKTRGLSKIIIEDRKNAPQNKILFCIAFTNNATSSIRHRLEEYYGDIPSNIRVSTIHSFLYEEIIRPYYYLLFGKHYKKISSIKLDNRPNFRSNAIKDLESNDILHIETIPERAKWVVSKKSTDRKLEKENRELVLKAFKLCCGKIYIDEAQDINSNIMEIITTFDSYGIEVFMCGDPKQDLKGYGCFRELIDKYQENVTYLNLCYRCPQKHLLLTNAIINEKEHQISTKENGGLSITFETDDVDLDISNYDLRYILKRNDRFETRRNFDCEIKMQNLIYETSKILRSMKLYSDKQVDVLSYYYSNKMICMIEETKPAPIVINELVKWTRFLSSAEYAKLLSILNSIGTSKKDICGVDSIERIKGLEGNNCLFILTSDLAPYLFKDKIEENKIKNALYVALTRSLDQLTIFVTKEVEEKYEKDYIDNYIKMLLNSSN